MPILDLKLIQANFTAPLFELIKRNHSYFKRYFPITLSKTKDLSSTESYVKELLDKVEKKTMFPFGIFADDLLIGMIYVKNIDWNILKCELGYYIDKEYSGKGISGKMVKQIEPFIFDELKLEKIFLRIAPDNLASKKIALKNAYLLEGTLRNEFRIETGELIDVEYYGKLAKEKQSKL